MWRCVLALMVTTGLACSAWGQQTSPRPTESAGRPRIGTYDPRAVAVAYAPSKLHSDELKAKMAELKEAEAKGDSARAAELKAWGKLKQERMHLQGFAGAGVDEILERLPAGSMERVAREAGADAIVRKGDYVSARAEVVDVTDAVVKLFGEPTERTKKIIEDLKKKAPLDPKVVEAAEKKGGI